MLFIVIVVLCCACITAKPLANSKVASANCGYDACPKVDSSKLNVHLVPHSHDDVGWLKTVDQYYYGNRGSIQDAGVQYIIESAIHALTQNQQRRFIQVETAFFHKWWNYQSEDVRETVRTLLRNGQLEFVGGAWSMNDEAAVHYQSTIDQFTLGLRFLNETFGECARPKVGWQIDPFGHSREMASIFAQMGYDGLFFARIDWRDKNQRMNSQSPEMIWKGSVNLEGNTSHLFTSTLYNHYSAPGGFCFDVKCGDDPLVDDEESPLYNIRTKVEDFAAFVRNQAKNYKTNNIIITMGDDFNYQDALSYFTNIDRLIAGFEQFEPKYNRKTINLFYSTPSCYLKAVNDESTENELAFPTKDDDFFPYATDYHAYWTGYYTSRPTSKRFERQGNNLLQAAKQLKAIVGGDLGDITPLMQAMGVMQHHDAITGTEKQHVAFDYHRMLYKAMQSAIHSAGDDILNLVGDGAVDYFKFSSCLLANISTCETSNKKSFAVIVYNPLSKYVSHHVKLPVTSTVFQIVDPNGNEVDYQVIQSPRDFSYTGNSISDYDLVFYAQSLPPLGYKVYQITADSNNVNIAPVETDQKYFIGDDTLGLRVDNTTGKVSTITVNQTTYNISQDLLYYEGAQGDNSEYSKRSSGAYIFRPSPDNPDALTVTENVEITTYKGDILEEIHQQFNSWITQVIRIYKNEKYIEFDWIVGPIDIEDETGKEVISRFTTPLQSGDTFYTDSNGREILERKRDYRATYNFTNNETVAGNYHPVTSKISIRDDDKNIQLSLLNDRAQGGTSLASGQLELMLHRRCLKDDAFGVGESLNETEYDQGLVARGQLYFTLNSLSEAARAERYLAQTKLLQPWVFLTATSFDGMYNVQKKFAGLTQEMPSNVHLLTLEPLTQSTVLLRLEHIFEEQEDSELSKPATVDLSNIFSTFKITALRETTLAADRWLDESQRLNWKTEEDIISTKSETATEEGNFVITIKPMQIRTFIATVER